MGRPESAFSHETTTVVVRSVGRHRPSRWSCARSRPWRLALALASTSVRRAGQTLVQRYAPELGVPSRPRGSATTHRTATPSRLATTAGEAGRSRRLAARPDGSPGEMAAGGRRARVERAHGRSDHVARPDRR